MKRLLALLVLFLLTCVTSAGGILISSKRTPPPLPSPSAWTFHDIGADTGTSADEIDASTFDLHCKGETDHTEGCALCQTVDSGPIQIIAEIGAFTGTTEDFTAGIVEIRDDTTSGAIYGGCMWPAVGQSRCKYRDTTGGSVQTGIFGATGQTIPQCEGVTYDPATATLNFFETNDADCAAGWNLIASEVGPVQVALPYQVCLRATSHNDANLVTTRFNHVSVSDELTLLPGTPPPTGRTGIYLTADWESGEVQLQDVTPDGCYLGRLVSDAEPPNDTDGNATWQGTSSNQEPFVSDTDYSRVVGTHGGVTPRTGSFQLLMKLDKRGDYSHKNDKTRTDCMFRGHRRDSSNTFWFGGSFHLPTGFEEETEVNQTLLVQSKMGSETDTPWFSLALRKSDLVVNVRYNATDPNPPGGDFTTAVEHKIDWNPSLVGQYTDWVINVHPDPDPAGNGFFKLWLNGVLEVNYTGQVGWQNLAGDDNGVFFAVDVYKGRWNLSATSVVGPQITVYFDAIRAGLVADGTEYDDVHPDQAAQP